MIPYQKYDDMFCIRQEKFDQDREKYYEGIFTQGSGYMHMRGSYEEGLAQADQNETYMRMPANVTIEKTYSPVSKWGTYIPGITGRHPLLNEEIVNLPYAAAFGVVVCKESLDMSVSEVTGYERYLDMRDGVLYRSFDWNTRNGAVLHLEYRRYLSRKQKNLLVQEIDITAKKGNCNAELYSDIDECVKTNGYDHAVYRNKKLNGHAVQVDWKTDNDNEIRIISLALCGDEYFTAAGNKTAAFISLQEGNTVHISKYSVYSGSWDEGGLSEEASLYRQLQKAVLKREELYEEHKRKWDSLWESSRIDIEGDEKAQKTVHFSVYHLLRCENKSSAKTAICAKGFSGEAYFGHFFWDTEIYLLPFYLHTEPEAAKRLCEFRINSLPGAMENAEKYGYPGARYAWESSVSGEEQCPNWQYADHEIHVTADVVFGLWHVYQNTGDFTFLKKALPVFMETARYWLSRVSIGKDGVIHLNGVMGPDEYVCFCSDNAYTNEMVSRTMQYTLDAIALIGKEEPQLLTSCGITEEETGRIKNCIKHLVLPSRVKGVIPQCSGFEELEEPEFDRIWKERRQPYGKFVSQERNYRTKALKQADVLMLPYLFPNCFSKEQIKENFDYYEPYTTHDSSLSAAVHAMICTQTGHADSAYDFFRQAMEIDFYENKGNAAEGVHIANCGGIWQTVVYGFAGLGRCYESEEPVIKPNLPPSFESLSFRIHYKQKNYQIKIDRNSVKITENPITN